jgi:hypothetical protein
MIEFDKLKFQIKRIDRIIRLFRKYTSICLLGLRPRALLGRFRGPKILINSIPKSGTNLVQELLIHFPNIRGTVDRTLSSLMTEAEIISAINSIKNGQCLAGHIYYSEKIDSALRENNVKVVFVIRDLRDSLISHMSYLENLDVMHPHTKYYNIFNSSQEKLEGYLRGSKDFEPWQFMCSRYRGWYENSNVFVARYEVLMDFSNPMNQLKMISDLAIYLGVHSVEPLYLLSKMINDKGLTYADPGIFKWKKLLSFSQIEMLNGAMIDELNFFGYIVD